MSITSFIKKVCVQSAVYWEYNGTDEFGSATFKTPVDILVRWDEKTQILSDNQGKEYVSDAEVLSPQDLLEQSYIMLGQLADLPSDPNPKETDGAFEIKAMDRHPLFKSKTLDVFIAYLSNG